MENKEYKKLIIDNEETTYLIYKDGRFFNTKTNKFYKGSIRQGYRYFDIRWKNKKISKTQHRLIAEYFIPNPNNFEYVHHIDGNKLNNMIDNLAWVTSSENNLKINRRPQNLDYSKFDMREAIENEQWVPYKDTRYMISDYGRVKNSETNKILKGKISLNGYREYTLKIESKNKTKLAHRLVWEAFKFEEPLVINHINGDKLDNRLINLENVNYLDNNLKALYETQTRKYNKIGQYDTEGNLIQIFINEACAAREMKVQLQSITYAIAKGTKSCGYYWKKIVESSQTMPEGSTSKEMEKENIEDIVGQK